MWVPNWWLKMLMQEVPHDGVAADAPPAVSAPATPTPPTRVSVAAAASTLLLMDMNGSSRETSRSCPAHGRVQLAPAARVGFDARSLGTLPARGGLIRTGTRS